MRNQFRPTVECLESRRLMAGDVMASLSGGNLDITGDNAANQVQVRQVNIKGADFIRVQGLWGTSLNSSQNGVAQFPASQVNNINIDTNGGNDYLDIRDITINRDLNIETDSGNDVVYMRNATVVDDVSIQTGSGNDVVRMYNGTKVGVAGDGWAAHLKIEMDGGNDFVSLIGVDVEYDTDIDTGWGSQSSNSVDVVNSNIGRSLIVDGSFGQDQIHLIGTQVGRDLDVALHNSDDHLRLSQVTVGADLLMDTGSGDDTVDFDNVEVGNLLDGKTGAGEDWVDMDNVTVHNDLLMDMGDDFDVLNMNHVDVTDLLWARLGDGTDFLNIYDSSAGRAHFWGDDGNDSLAHDNNDFDFMADPVGFMWVSN